MADTLGVARRPSVPFLAIEDGISLPPTVL
jgi:hypothetical protein